MMDEDLATATGLPEGTVVTGDSRSEFPWSQLSDATVDACLTSPPYLNNFDYADATRLELYFWTAVDSWRDMCDAVRSGMVVATTQQSSRSQALKDMAAVQDVLPTIADDIAVLVSKLRVERAKRTRGKEYDQVLPGYLSDLRAVLNNLSRVMKSGSVALFVVGDSAPYGIYVDTPALLGRVAESVGFQVTGDKVLRRRGHRWTTTQRHSLPLSERVLTLRRG
jgi:hypothetical protein